MLANVIPVSYDLWVVALSYLIASYASFVALDLARRMYAGERAMIEVWWTGGSVAMGTGIWSMHFVGMLALNFPGAVGYAYVMTALSWLAAVGASAVALYVASLRQLTAFRLGSGALVMGAGICAMHYSGMAALDMAPGIRWNLALVAASAAIAVAASGAALLIFVWLRRLSGFKARQWQLAAALIMGFAICGMHYTGMAAASFPEGTVCLSANQLRGDSLGLLVSVAAAALLTMTLFTSVLDARMQSRTALLAQSLQHANAELQQMAFRDALTGLPNRLLFDDRVATAALRSKRDDTALAVLFIDLDGFKPVNDSFGHACGDAVLREVAHRLAELTRSADTVARVGGDEFVLLLEGNPDATAAARMAERIVTAIALPITGTAQEVRLSCSIGIAMYPIDGPLNQLLARADAAMYAAKRTGGANYAYFEPHMNADMREQIDLQRDLRVALELGGQLLLYYQPKIDTASGKVTGVEALVRWQHPQRGLVGPGLFIAVAERFGLIGALGDWVIDEACRQIRQWLDQGLRMRVSINLSVHQLRQDDLVQRVDQLLSKHRVDAELLTFEITESVAMDDAAGSLRAFERLCGLGVKLSIDDFGTGYSSLSYLRRLHATELKIDQSFITDLGESGDARAIVEAVVRLAHALGLRVVAEGVETSVQLEALKALRCDESQGYLFSRPIAASQLAQWALAQRSADDADPAGANTSRPSFDDSVFMSEMHASLAAPMR